MAKRLHNYRKVIVHMMDELPPALIGKMMMEMGDEIRRKHFLTDDAVVEMNREPDDNNVNYNVRIVMSRGKFEKLKSKKNDRVNNKNAKRESHHCIS